MNDTNKLDLVIKGRERDLGGFSVRRVLPYLSHRMVGPFIFFDHMGPAEMKPGNGINVRPHPHINLATVTYLFEGVIRHQDSLGSDQLIEPGAINWMTAGRGIVHSERTPEALKGSPTRMHGIQLWVAVPEAVEEGEPSFSHHPKETLPSFEVEGVALKLLLGTAFGFESPVPIHSDMCYLEVKMKQGQCLIFPSTGREIAIYAVDGLADVDGTTLEPYSMAIGASDPALILTIEAKTDCKLMLLGGAPLGKRYIYWNFVSSAESRIEEAKVDWSRGPRAASPRFPLIPNDKDECIPLPDEPERNPKGTIM